MKELDAKDLYTMWAHRSGQDHGPFEHLPIAEIEAWKELAEYASSEVETEYIEECAECFRGLTCNHCAAVNDDYEPACPECGATVALTPEIREALTCTACQKEVQRAAPVPDGQQAKAATASTTYCEGGVTLLTRDEMEIRRLRAAEFLGNGGRQAQISGRFGVSRATASRWCRKVRALGVAALRKRAAPGRPSRMTPEQRRQVCELWTTRPSWTENSFQAAILEAIGIKYDPDHVGRLMHQLGLRPKRVKASAQGGGL